MLPTGIKQLVKLFIFFKSFLLSPPRKYMFAAGMKQLVKLFIFLKFSFVRCRNKFKLVNTVLKRVTYRSLLKLCTTNFILALIS